MPGSAPLRFTIIALAAVAVLAPTSTQAKPAVQEITGHLARNEFAVYRLKDLKKSRALFVHVRRTDGNLDPFTALFLGDVDPESLREEFQAELDRSIETGKDPLIALPKMYDKYSLIWADDSAKQSMATFELVLPQDGDYLLLVRCANILDTFGEYRLLIGLDAPDVMTGQASPTEAELAELDMVLEPQAQRAKAVSHAKGKLAPQNSPTFFALEPMRTGETLHVYVEATTGDLRPILFLADYSGKPLRSANFNASETSAKLTYTFEKEARNYQIRLSSIPRKGEPTAGQYRLLVGVDAPEVLTGQAKVQGVPVLRQPIHVKVGLGLHQIADIDQKAERYEGVYDLMMKWQDRDLAFTPKSPQDNIRIFRQEDFIKYAEANSVIAPLFTLYNQQGRRWSQNQMTLITPEGRAIYYERFWSKLQAPDFEFTKFPFDTQKFFARLDMLFPTRFFVWEDLEDFSEVGTALGEEEWVVESFQTIVDTKKPKAGSPTSSFTFSFFASRHLNYYILRIFLPVFAIIAIAWVTFFLKDYGKRVDLAGANLLVFIAFNFTIADDLPRLGYLTVMDVVLISTFLITSMVLICCVVLRRMHSAGREDLVDRLDTYLIWSYPIAYLLVGGIVTAMLLS